MKRYKKYMTPYLSAFIIGPLLMLTEVFGEIMLPKLMSLIINNGVAERDIHYIMTIGAIMVLTTSVMAVGESAALISRPRHPSALPAI